MLDMCEKHLDKGNRIDSSVDLQVSVVVPICCLISTLCAFISLSTEYCYKWGEH
jgi:hypothetical protein